MSSFLVGIVDEFILYYGYCIIIFYITPRARVYLLIINIFWAIDMRTNKLGWWCELEISERVCMWLVFNIHNLQSLSPALYDHFSWFSFRAATSYTTRGVVFSIYLKTIICTLSVFTQSFSYLCVYRFLFFGLI